MMVLGFLVGVIEALDVGICFEVGSEDVSGSLKPQECVVVPWNAFG